VASTTPQRSVRDDDIETRPQNRQLLTVSEVARQLGVSPALVYQLVTQGRLACYRVGLRRGAIRFQASDVEAYLESCRVEPEERRRVPRPRLRHIKL
jgi:excisionase family DNA binding protein